MCLAVPGKILSIKGNSAEADFGGIKRKIDISMLPGCRQGDYVLVHVGFAIQKIDEESAKETHRLLSEAAGWNLNE